MSDYRDNELSLIESLQQEIQELKRKLSFLESKVVWHQEVTIVHGDSIGCPEDKTYVKFDFLNKYRWLIKRDRVPVGAKMTIAILEPTNENYSSKKE